MDQYQNFIKAALNGVHKKNRTDADTIASFSAQQKFDLASSFPLLTTKKMDTYRWESMVHELLWYLSGDHHIRNLREETNIWDAWADEDWNLPSAYGRFWRRHPIPNENAQLPGEAWADTDCQWVTLDDETDTLVFDQLEYMIDTLQGENPNKTPNSRRLVVSSWHPANASVSNLPPCHYTFNLNVQDGKLNCHLTQRSADIALGVPFNIASYSLLTKIISEVTDFTPGAFAHTLVDAHIYCGKSDRGEWYSNNLSEIQKRISTVGNRGGYADIRDWIIEEAPPEESDSVDPSNHKYGYDHVPGLIEQLSREPLDLPNIRLDIRSLDDMSYEDIQLTGYNSHSSIKYEVSE